MRCVSVLHEYAAVSQLQKLRVFELPQLDMMKRAAIFFVINIFFSLFLLLQVNLATKAPSDKRAGLQHASRFQNNMDRLPAEIFEEITSHLSINNRLECIRVCKHWHEAISSFNLFDEITFQRRQKKELALFNKEKDLGQQVHHLSVSHLDMYSDSLISLIECLPRLTTLKWKEADFNDLKEEIVPPHDVLLQSLPNWKNLEHIVDSTVHLAITARLLESCTSKYLKYLCVSPRKLAWLDIGTSGTLYKQPELKSLLSHIQNAPILEEICLSSTAIVLTSMEELHSKLPYLKSVTLDNVPLYQDDGGDIMVQQAAEPVRCLNFICSPAFHHHAVKPPGYVRTLSNWISYMTKKYPTCNKSRFALTTVNVLNIKKQELD